MEDEIGPIRQASVAVMGIGPLVEIELSLCHRADCPLVARTQPWICSITPMICSMEPNIQMNWLRTGLQSVSAPTSMP